MKGEFLAQMHGTDNRYGHNEQIISALGREFLIWGEKTK